jgi:hypothetical protein
MRHGHAVWVFLALGGAIAASCSGVRQTARQETATPPAEAAPPAQFLVATACARGEMFACG